MTVQDRVQWRSLRNRAEFQKVYEGGVKKVGRFLVVYLLTADDMARGVVASRKVGGAVQRNRAKRLLREAFRGSDLARSRGVEGVRAKFLPDGVEPGPDATGRKGLQIVLVARQRILTTSSQEVLEELEELLGS